MKAKDDVELRAIRTIVKILEDLDRDSRVRVIGYVWSRVFGQSWYFTKGAEKYSSSDLFEDVREKEAKEDSCEG